jgi:hypothetical protein
VGGTPHPFDQVNKVDTSFDVVQEGCAFLKLHVHMHHPPLSWHCLHLQRVPILGKSPARWHAFQAGGVVNIMGVAVAVVPIPDVH